jgi:hypothetical protein
LKQNDIEILKYYLSLSISDPNKKKYNIDIMSNVTKKFLLEIKEDAEEDTQAITGGVCTCGVCQKLRELK